MLAYPPLIAAAIFLAALTSALGLQATQWRQATGGTIIQIPATGSEAAAALLGPTARRLSRDDLQAALQPWLGKDTAALALTLPAVFERPGSLPPGLEQALARAAPGVIVSHGMAWQQRLAARAGGVQACAAAALGVIALLAAGVSAVVVRAGLSADGGAAETTHLLGATDGAVAGGVANRLGALAAAGGVGGAALAALLLLAVAHAGGGAAMPWLPASLWAALAALPLIAALIGWVTAQAVVRSWLARLP